MEGKPPPLSLPASSTGRLKQTISVVLSESWKSEQKVLCVWFFFFFSPPRSDVLIADVSSVRAGQAPLVSGLRPNSISPLHSAKWSEGLIHRSLINRWSSDELVLQWGRPEVIHLRFMPGAPKYKQIRGIILYNTRYNTAAGPSTCVFVYQYASMIPKHAGTTWVLAVSVL